MARSPGRTRRQPLPEKQRQKVPEKRVETWEYPVRPLRVFLVHCQFVDERPADEEVSFPDETDFLTGLVFSRPSARVLGVGMSLETGESAPVRIQVTYAVEYEVSSKVPPEERESLLEVVGYEIAPALLYTYIREFFSNLTSRWRGGAVPLPLLPMPMYEPSERPPIPRVNARPKVRQKTTRTEKDNSVGGAG